MPDIGNDMPPRDIRDAVCSRLGESVESIDPIQSDVSSRRFFRLRTVSKSLVLMMYPDADAPSMDRDVTMITSFALAGLTPPVLARGESWLIVADGGRPLDGFSAALAERALALIPGILTLPGEIRDINEPMDSLFLARELRHTLHWFVGAFMGCGAVKPIEAFFESLAEEVGAFPREFCHRDFHGDNILDDGSRLWIVDVQDARLGPRFYDAASLLFERGFADLAWSDREELIDRVLEEVHRVQAQPEAIRELFLTAAQRCLKALGTFAYQVLSGRCSYLRHLEAGRAILAELLARIGAPGDVVSILTGSRRFPQPDTISTQ